MKLAVVDWFDASYERGELTTEEITTRCEIRTAGFLVKEDKETITLALDFYATDKTWRHIAHIPKVNVIRIKRIKVE